MKAIDLPIGTVVRKEVCEDNASWFTTYYDLYGIVIYNNCRKGDEFIVVEWNNTFNIEVINVNDIETKVDADSGYNPWEP